MYMLKYLLITVLSLSVFSCYTEEDFVRDNIKEGGTYYPVVQDVIAEPIDGNYAEGSTVQLTIYYWSRDELATIEFFETIDNNTNLIHSATTPSGYDEERNVDFVSYLYTIPPGSSGKEIQFTGTVTTVHDLQKSANATITVE